MRWINLADLIVSQDNINKVEKTKEIGEEYTGWNDTIVVLKKTTLQLYFKTFIEKIYSDNLSME